MAVPMIGRDDALAALDENVRTARLVTIIGPGGVGKTRLVTEWAARFGERFAGVLPFLSLVAVRDDDGAVVGVRAEGPEGTVEERGPVVLATSSYDWDPELVQEFLGLEAGDSGSAAPPSIRGAAINRPRVAGAAGVGHCDRSGDGASARGGPFAAGNCGR